MKEMNSLGNNSRLGLLPLLPVSDPGEHVRVVSRNIYTARPVGLLTLSRQPGRVGIAKETGWLRAGRGDSVLTGGNTVVVSPDPSPQQDRKSSEHQPTRTSGTLETSECSSH